LEIKRATIAAANSVACCSIHEKNEDIFEQLGEQIGFELGLVANGLNHAYVNGKKGSDNKKTEPSQLNSICDRKVVSLICPPSLSVMYFR
jgi:hypothetical protein